MKSLIAFATRLLDDIGERCGVSTIRDRKTVTNRVEHEGISFLTISLSAFAKDFERGLELGRVSDDLFMGFSHAGGLPRFLGGFLRKVFDSGTGVLLDEELVDVESIRGVRQFCLAFGKISLPCSDERVERAFASYIECEKELASVEFSEASLRDFRLTAWALFQEILIPTETKLELGETLPRHGPGATADGLTGNGKYQQTQWHSRLEPYFPAGEFIFPSWSYWQDLQEIEFLEPGDEMPVKVISVPKTLKTPRIIAIEPTCMQYTQQAVSREIVSQIERHDYLSDLVGFRDQLPNQELALEGSLFGELATLDLSEASDRVSNQLVKELLRFVPRLSGAVQACRSLTAGVPGHGIVSLSKFASMGSALCFPMEAMVFLTIIFMVLQEHSGRRFTSSDFQSHVGRVRVYGDDIIVPVDMAPLVIDRLESFGLRVNRSKSFLNGKFRESCGGDFYNGEWVTPIRVREIIPESRRQAGAVASTVALRNHLYVGGYERSYQYLDKILEKILPVYPDIPLGHDALGKWTYAPVYGTRVHPHLHKPLVKACVVDAKPPNSHLDGPHALMKFFLERGREPLPKSSFTRAGRPVVLNIRPQWVSLEIQRD